MWHIMWNYYCEIIIMCKTGYFKFISISNDSKSFWTHCKPYFSNQHAIENCKIMLLTAIKKWDYC